MLFSTVGKTQSRMNLLSISINNKETGGKLGAKFEEVKKPFSNIRVKSVDEEGLFYANGVRIGLFFVNVDGLDVSKLAFKDVQAKVLAANKKMNEGETISFVFTDSPDLDPNNKSKVVKKGTDKSNNDEDGDDDDIDGDYNSSDDDYDRENDDLRKDEDDNNHLLNENLNTLSSIPNGPSKAPTWGQIEKPGWRCNTCLAMSPFGAVKCVACEAHNPDISSSFSNASAGFSFGGASNEASTTSSTFSFGFGPSDPSAPPPFALPAFGSTAGGFGGFNGVAPFAPPQWGNTSSNSSSNVGGVSPSPFGGAVPFGGGGGGGASAIPVPPVGANAFGVPSSNVPVFSTTTTPSSSVLSFGGGAVSLPSFNFSRASEISVPTTSTTSAIATSATPISAQLTSLPLTSVPSSSFKISTPTTVIEPTLLSKTVQPSSSSETTTSSVSVNSTLQSTLVSLPPSHPHVSSVPVPVSAISQIPVSQNSLSTSQDLFPLDTSSISLEVLSARGSLKLKPDPVFLSGRFVLLEPYDELKHLDALSNALLGDAYLGHPTYDAEMLIWRYLWGSPISKVGLKERLAESANCPDRRIWTISLIETKEIVGIIGLIANRPFDLVVEIGLIMVTPAYQRTPVASDATFALLKHVFSLKYRRVEWKTNVYNKRSRNAAERMGFVFEGIFRHHMIIQGGASRDTAWYSMLTEDWKEVKTVLEYDSWLKSSEASDLFVKRKLELSKF